MSTLEHTIESCFKSLNNSKKTKELLQNKKNNNKKISWRSHCLQRSLNDKSGQSKAKDWWYFTIGQSLIAAQFVKIREISLSG